MLDLRRRYTDQKDGSAMEIDAKGKTSVKQNFNKKAIDALSPRSKRFTVYDEGVRGLGILVQPTGHKAFFWFRKVNGKPTWKTIGDFPSLSIENARMKASEYNAALARASADGFQHKVPLFEKRRAPLTVGDALKDYIERHLKTDAVKNPTRASEGAQWQFDRYLPDWKNTRLDAITKEAVEKLYEQTKKKYGLFTGNRTIQLVRALFYWASNHMSWQGDNPARIKLVSEKKFRRRRYLQRDEAVRLIEALNTEPSQNLKDFVILALFTMARKGDVLSMRWQDINWDTEQWTIPDPKNKEPYVVPLGPEEMAVLNARKKDGVYVFPGHGKSKHLVGFKSSWTKLLERAKLADFRTHDLRRTLGSHMAQGRESLYIIGQALGHSEGLAVTSTYGQLQTDTVREAKKLAVKRLLGKP
jgi:integrase